MNVEILDCTLRDGGYNNAWSFSDALVGRYLDALDQTGVEYVELGYRAVAPDGFAGHYRYCPDDLVRSLMAGRTLRAAVMIDAKAMCEQGAEHGAARLEALFGARCDSPIELVRIAATAASAGSAAVLCVRLKELGYRVAINVMQASILDVAAVRGAALQVNGSGADYLYLADSFGALTPEATEDRVGPLAAAFDGRVGFHAHDNLGLALANSIAAIRAGARIIDCSVLGMGRGAGNLRTEQFLTYLTRTGHGDVTAAPLLEIAATEFAGLQAVYGWGSSVPYLVTGSHDIHPTYAQELLRRQRHSALDVIRTLTSLATHPGRHAFDAERLDGSLATTRPERAPGRKRTA